MNRTHTCHPSRHPARRGQLTLLALVFVLGVGQARAEGGVPLPAHARLPTNLQLQSVTCPDAHTCFTLGTRAAQAGGLVILASHDGGASWSAVHTQPGLGFGFLSCPSPRQCYVIGSSYSGAGQNGPVSLLHTSDGGKSWQRSSVGSLRTAGFAPTQLDCPSSAVCYLGGSESSVVRATGQTQNRGVLAVTKDGGKSWAQVRLPSSITIYPRALACTSVTSCYAGGVIQETACFQAGGILHTDDGGKTWSRQFGDCAAGISSLACPTASTCYAGGWYGAADEVGNQLVLHTSDGGASWNDQLEGPIDPTYVPFNSPSWPITGIACPGAEICFLPTGKFLIQTTDGGATWSIRAPVKSAALQAVTCPTTRQCVAVGWIQPAAYGPGPIPFTAVILRTIDGGNTWTRL